MFRLKHYHKMNAIKLHANKKQPLYLNVCVAYQGCLIELSHCVLLNFLF